MQSSTIKALLFITIKEPFDFLLSWVGWEVRQSPTVPCHYIVKNLKKHYIVFWRLTNWDSREKYQKPSSLFNVVWVECDNHVVSSYNNALPCLIATVYAKCVTFAIGNLQVVIAKIEIRNFYLSLNMEYHRNTSFLWMVIMILVEDNRWEISIQNTCFCYGYMNSFVFTYLHTQNSPSSNRKSWNEIFNAMPCGIGME